MTGADQRVLDVLDQWRAELPPPAARQVLDQVMPQVHRTRQVRVRSLASLVRGHPARLLVLAGAVMAGSTLAWALAAPTPPRPADMARMLLVRQVPGESGTPTPAGYDVSLLAVDGTNESVVRIPPAWFPADLGTAPWDAMLRPPAMLTFGASDGNLARLESIDLADPDARIEDAVGSLSPRPDPPTLCGAVDMPCHSGIEEGIESGPAADGTYRAWASGPGLSAPVWAADGGVWFATVRVAGDTRSASLTHITPGGTSTTSPPFGLPAGATIDVGSSAPDGTLVALRYDLVDGDTETAVVDPTTGIGSRAPGWPIAWVGSEQAAGLRRSGIMLDRGTPLGESGPAVVTLRSFDAQVARLAISRILLRHEEPASDHPVRFDTGVFWVMRRHGVDLSCGGPGQVHILASSGLPNGGHGDIDCASTGGRGLTSSRDTASQVSVTVQADPGVAWRLIIYDTGY